MSIPCPDYDFTKGLSSVRDEIETQRRKVELETVRLQVLLERAKPLQPTKE